MKSFLRAATLSLALAATAAPLAPARAQAESADRFHATTLSLSAYGETKIAPDMASIRLGVTTSAPSAAEAMSANSGQMSRMLAALKAAGVAERDIQTSALNLNPQYVYAQNQPPRLTGYQATNDVTVQVRDLARLGPAVDATVSAGANQVNSIAFSLADPTPAQDAAREKAVRALQAKAELYAHAAGYRVARLVSLSEGGGAALPTPVYAQAAARMQAVPVAPGELNVRADVTGVFELTR